VEVPDANIAQELVRRETAFNELVQAGVLEVGLSLEKRAALKELALEYQLFLNSATPLPALRESLEALEIVDMWTGVYGRLDTKEDNLQAIITNARVTSGEVLVVDDQPNVAAVAHRLGCQFIGIHTAAFPEWNAQAAVGSIAELVGLLRFS